MPTRLETNVAKFIQTCTDSKELAEAAKFLATLIGFRIYEKDKKVWNAPLQEQVH